MRALVEGAAEEAAAGLTATRVICGWRIVADREPPGAWLITAVQMAHTAYPRTPPMDTIVAAMVIAHDAGAPRTMDITVDVKVGELRLAWHESPQEPPT